MDDPLADTPTKGRGAVSNPAGRFEPERRHGVDDGWDFLDDLPPLRTEVTDEPCRTILTRNRSPDIPFETSINPYKGCEHGCVYCYARPSHSYMGLSPGLDFETRLFAKPAAAALLDQELRKASYRPQVIALGSNTDPYQPIERHRKITRSVLEVLSRFNNPVGIVTKSALVLRDIDILAPMAEKGLASVAVSVTSLDNRLQRLMEPRASSPKRRLEAIRGLSAAGIPVTVMAAPMIPFLNDPELERILDVAAAAGARGAGYIHLRLPYELKDLFSEWLEAHYPEKAKHVLSRIRQNRGGDLSSAHFGERMRGTGEHADLLAKRFRLACKRLGLNNARDEGEPELGLDTGQFSIPLETGDQLALF
ncbi:MAG: PA0069 family radical SAM protein [Rhodospirillales bacterium]|nr:PA0069 family radical SAM protein [Rhodospirillales bacterium]